MKTCDTCKFPIPPSHSEIGEWLDWMNDALFRAQSQGVIPGERTGPVRVVQTWLVELRKSQAEKEEEAQAQAPIVVQAVLPVSIDQSAVAGSKPLLTVQPGKQGWYDVVNEGGEKVNAAPLRQKDAEMIAGVG